MKRNMLLMTGLIGVMVATDAAAMLATSKLKQTIRFTSQDNKYHLDSYLRFINMQYNQDEYHKNSWERNKTKVTEIVIEAIKKGETIDKPAYETSGYTPLCYAIEGDDFEFVELLVKNGADVNQEIKGMHSSRPIFYANSLEMVKLLQSHGANIHEINKGQGVSGGMNFLHGAIGVNSQDDRLIKYALEQGLDPESLDDHGRNLWHSLVWISARYCPEEKLIRRAQLLHSLGINPYYEDNKGVSAIDIVKKEVESETKFLNENPKHAHPDRVAMRDKMERLLTVMEMGVPSELKNESSMKKERV